MSDKEKIEQLTNEVISLRKQVDSLTPKLYHIQAWYKVLRNGIEDKSYIVDLKHKCYSHTQAESYLDAMASKSSIGGRSIYTSVEQIEFIKIENDWVNQLVKKIVI